MLTRAGSGLLGRGDPQGAESVLKDAADLLAGTGDAVARGITMDYLGRAIRDQGRAAEAEETFRRALALAEEGGASEDVLVPIQEDLQNLKSSGALL